MEWTGLVVVGLACAYAASKIMLIVACIFALQGIIYNVPPIRTKDEAYLDVVSESVNNPLRLMIGWAMVDPTALPPSSIILMYWAGGAFLMAAKRLSEFGEITASHGREVLEQYRASFTGYSEISLTVSLGLAAHHVVAASDVGLLKPHARGLQSLMAAASATARDTLFIGDRVDRDGVAGQRAGVRTLIRSLKPIETFQTFRTFHDPLFDPFTQ